MMVGSVVLLAGVVLYAGWVFVAPLLSERLAGHTRLERQIELVDEALRAAFIEASVSRTHVAYDSTEMRYDAGRSWRFREVGLRLRTPAQVSALASALRARVPPTGARLRLHSIEHGLAARITVAGVATHEIMFTFPRRGKSARRNRRPVPPPVAPSPPATVGAAPVAAGRNGIPAPLGSARPKVAIIVDDMGRDKESVERLLAIEAPLAFAVLPHLPYSSYTARRAHAHGRDVLLHLPMEPDPSSGYDASDAGDGVLLTTFSEEEIVRIVDEDLASVPYVVGVNNHMGSKFTEDARLMEVVLRRIRDRGLFFVDSRTTAATKGYETARRLGVKAIERKVFLDEGGGGTGYVKAQLRRLVEESRRHGRAVAICHPYPETVEALREEIPRLKKEVDIVPVSSLVR